ncbi:MULTISPECIES: carbohydrate ABC transporter permease [Pseudonocardia]|uniref:Lactose transport system permease protein LacF n=2 Tax=Pseudonocardia TaxID=1847 RepID=A0A1Y2MKW0_PSEAH|nr:MULTISPECIES: sugar ABC transporter permease [Pseudonocardia]OSY35904.1 Lactose transport system permease protein LacF [Pseudonocardia autotrophica]TDN73988.1 carbohydrate ABC transporter membrane protein 1 (CUT1 family) [Pseudonocardia autotrophica]BBG04745.1 glycerol-3-phosphate ABC transporter permease [Pseudonocardia autotrophica]GEC28906.1 glycerol-3-phosphate ABC transporter permease [Pseudonocardia saturnea]
MATPLREPAPARDRTTAGAPAPVPRRRTSRDVWTAALFFLAPAVVALLALRIIPTLSAVETSIPFGTDRALLSNFTYIFSDPDFLGSLRVTLLFSLVVNPIQIGLALALAVLLTKKLPAVGLWRTLILLPIAVPQAVSAIIWLVLMRPDGPLNGVANALGLPSVPWLVSPDVALASIVIVCSWVGVGYWMTFLVTGIRDIPTSLYEASSIDGANGWQQFRSITLPGLRRPLLFVLVADTVSNLLIFAPVRVLTQGGPQGSTNMIMYDISERAYTLGDTQAASAGTLVLVVIVVAIVAVQFRLLPGKD